MTTSVTRSADRKRPTPPPTATTSPANRTLPSRPLRRCEKAAREADDVLLAPLSPAERERFMDLLIGNSGTQS
ncbi:hypothetical protein [Streptomyces sp. NPDC056464]|uniref:hypothetical protein n=1 Tax=Streptomyces sp. NPDC056464 TaxID=3345828 RepID=UPI0036BEBB4A